MKRSFQSLIAIMFVISSLGCSASRQVITVNRDCAAVPLDAKVVDFLPAGWKILETVTPSNFKVEDLEFRDVTRGNEFQISGIDLRSRSEKWQTNLGLEDAIAVLIGQQKLPFAMRAFEIIFTGTVVIDNLGMKNISVIRWSGSCWQHSWIGYHDTSYFSSNNKVPHI